MASLAFSVHWLPLRHRTAAFPPHPPQLCRSQHRVVSRPPSSSLSLSSRSMRRWSASLDTSSVAPVQAPNEPRELVDKLLLLVVCTDRGASLAVQQRAQVEGLIGRLESHCMAEPLKSPLILGEWDVVYSSSPTATGGYYRSAIGRALLKTKQMIQTIAAPNIVENKVVFDALGLLPGEVSLKGELEPLDNRWIKVNFEPPDLKVGPLKLQHGGISTVKIAIIYLDERVRLGRGSRGSLFVFKRR